MPPDYKLEFLHAFVLLIPARPMMTSTNNAKPDGPRRFRRFFRFTLKGLLFVMLVTCVLLGRKATKARQQRAAVDWVQEIGGIVTYDYQVDADFAPVPNAKPLVPNWLVQTAGIDFFSQVVRVDVPSIAQINSLEPLSGLASVELLYLTNLPVDDITPLCGMTRLKCLGLQGTNVRDLSPLANLKHLRFLQLDRTQVTDLTPLARLSSLETLQLDETPVNDIAPLSRLSKLEWLNLDGTQVADLPDMSSMTRLKYLSVVQTRLDEDEVNELQAEIPQCRIVFRR